MKFFTGMFLVVALVIFIFLNSLLNAWVLQYLWTWFIVPLGVTTITMPHAFGISLVYSLLSHKPGQNQKSSEDEPVAAFTKLLLEIFAAPLFLLLLGYIVHQYM